MTKVPIVVIAWRAIEIDTIRCLRAAEQTGRYEVVYSYNDALVSRSRSLTSSRFLRGSDADVMVFVDSDIVFDVPSIDKVVALAREKQSVAGGAYSVRKAQEAWPAVRWKPETATITFGGRSAPLIVEYVSGGFMAIPKNVLQKMSESMPLCTSGSSTKQPFWPFFQPVLHKYGDDWEYLSEDWSFCQQAQDAGFDIWLDTQVTLGHIGTKLYQLTQLQKFGPTEIERGDLVTDVAKFFRMKTDQLVSKGSASKSRSKLNKKWQRVNPKNQSEVAKLLDDEETIWDDFFNYTKVNSWIELDAALKCTGRVGVLRDPLGCLSLALAKRRAIVYLTETSKAQEKFIEWRLKQHSVEGHIWPSLPDIPDKLDFILGVEYIEHRHPGSYPEFAEQVFNALVPGGQLLLFGNWNPEGDSRVFAGGREAFAEAMLDVGMTLQGNRWIKMPGAQALLDSEPVKRIRAAKEKAETEPTEESEPRVTAVVLAYWPERLKHIGQIVADLEEGSVKPDRILVLNNNPKETLKVEGAEVINSGANFETRGKYIAALLDASDYYLLMDDDTSVGEKTLELFLEHAHRDCCYGYVGITLKDGSFARGDQIRPQNVTEETPCDGFWGAGVFLSFNSLLNMVRAEEKLRLEGHKWPVEGDDILVGLANKASVLPMRGNECFVTLGEEGVGLRFSGRDYFLMRDEFTRDALRAIGETSGEEQDRDMVIEDLAGYTDRRPAEISERLLRNPAKQKLAEAWRETSPQTPEDVDTYYKSQEAYVHDLAWFNIRPSYWTQVRPLLKLSGRVIDFGGGIGTLSMALGRRGCEVAYVDLPSPQRTFAEWRFAKHDYPISVHDSLDSTGVANSVVAVDTIEHIHPDMLPIIAEKMFNALRPGGSAYTINKFFDSGNEPMHYTTESEFRKAMHAAGFEGGPIAWMKR